jgi:hypothetical protein
MSNLIVWDLETVPDLKGYAAANGHAGKSDDEVRAELGDKFPKHIYHSIICIGALVSHREDGGCWTVDALGAPHVGERPEKELIASFVDRIAALSPQLVTFNGSSFDLPVLRYRAMVHVSASTLRRPEQVQNVVAKNCGYSMTSSASASSDEGTAMSSKRAVWALMTSSNLVDCITGRSAGLAPFRIRPV